jgi:septal ring factor EnvC (AmiA/AmiB activator)
MDAAGHSPSPLPHVTASSAASADLVRLLHQRRSQLVERETALQRWVVALELEAARQAAAAEQLALQDGKVARLAAESAEHKEAARQLLEDVSAREQQLQRDAAALEQQHAAVQREAAALQQERAALESAAAEVAVRAGDMERRAAALSSQEDEWRNKVQAAEEQLKVRIGGGSWGGVIYCQGGRVARIYGGTGL